MVNRREQHEQRLFVEGGGDNDSLRTECRRAFTKLLERAGFAGRMPSVIACGGRQQAYDKFVHALSHAATGDTILLLVDAEGQVTTPSPWDHVRNREGDQWIKPPTALDDHLHLMVQSMETWLLADRDSLKTYFGSDFAEKTLPATTNVESVARSDALAGLKSATKRCETKGPYDKGRHSFRILETVDPAKLSAACKSAERFFSTLNRLLA